MEWTNDLGLTLEIAGFIIFLYIPIRETFNIGLSQVKESKFTKKMDKRSVRIFGILLVFVGLILQYNLVRDLF